MKIKHRHTITRIISKMLLLVLAFSFAHSELNQFVFDDSDHVEHDYCKLVDDTTTRIAKYSNQFLIEQHLIDGLSNSIVIPDNSKPNCFSNYIDYDTKTLQYSNDIYIYTQTFLI